MMSWEGGLDVWERFEELNIECDDWSDYYQIERDEADIIGDGGYGCYHSRGKVAVCAPGVLYLPDYWFSRYPARIPATWNLLKLFDPPGWIGLFLSIVGVTIVFFFSARLGRHFGIPIFNEEIIFSPFRQMLDP